MNLPFVQYLRYRNPTLVSIRTLALASTSWDWCLRRTTPKPSWCTYGGFTSVAAVLKDVTLTYEVLSKPLTTAEIQRSLAKAGSIAKSKIAALAKLAEKL
jgi:hypothetical protein